MNKSRFNRLSPTSRIVLIFSIIGVLSGCQDIAEEHFKNGINYFRVIHTKYFGPNIGFEFPRSPTRSGHYVDIRVIAHESVTLNMIYPNIGGSCRVQNWVVRFPINLERGETALLQTDCNVILDLVLLADSGEWTYQY